MTRLERPRGGRSFRASIRHKGKDYPLGLFETEWDAALAYNTASEAIGRGARPPNEIPLKHRPAADKVREITHKVKARLGLNPIASASPQPPPSDAVLTSFFEITVVGFWRDQASRDALSGLDTASGRILQGLSILFWDRDPSFHEEILTDLVVRRLNATFGRADVTRAVLDDDRDSLPNLAWWLALPDHREGARGFREEVEYRYAELFRETDSASPSWSTRLGVSPPFSLDQIRRAYRSRSRTAHPDAGGSNPEFVRLHEAYREALRFLRDRRH